MRVIAKRALRYLWKKHSDCEQQLKAWYSETEKAEWKNINALKKEYPSASILKDNRFVFNLKGNTYRLIFKFNFDYQISWIRFIGTTLNTTRLTLIGFEMNITPIRNEKDYQKALKRLEKLFAAKKGSKEGDELEVLSILVDRYENEKFPIGMPDPIEAI